MISSGFKLNGLILAGGRSSRMGSAKALLPYQDQPQFQRIAGLLGHFCTKTWLSCQAEQNPDFRAAGWIGPMVNDQPAWEGRGPLSGVLSAFELEKAAWLVCACDYPLLAFDDLAWLLQHRQADAPATAFQTAPDAPPEPLIALYEAHAAPLLAQWYAQGGQSLSQFLTTFGAHVVTAPQPLRLRSIDTPEAYQWAQMQLQQR